jgi:hypothetical protein
LTYATYERLGGLKGAIASRAEEVLSQQEPEVQEALKSVLFALVQVSHNEHGAETLTGRACPLASFVDDGPQRRLIDAFLDPRARLLVGDEASGVPVVRLAHEALLTEWERARDVLREDGLLLQIRRMTEERYARWTESRSRNGLLAGDDLSDAERLVRAHANELPPEIVDYIRRSASHARAIRHQAFLMATSVAVVMTMMAAGAGWMWLRSDTEVLHLRFVDNDSDGLQAIQDRRYDLAIATFQSNVQIGHQLIDRASQEPELQLNLAKAHADLGLALYSRGRGNDHKLAHGEFVQAKAMVDKLTAAQAGGPRIQAECAQIESRLLGFLKKSNS